MAAKWENDCFSSERSMTDRIPTLVKYHFNFEVKYVCLCLVAKSLANSEGKQLDETCPSRNVHNS